MLKPNQVSDSSLPERDPSRKASAEDAGSKLPDRYVSREVAAEFLSLSSQTLASWASAGIGPAFTKLSAGRSGAVRYRLSELERYAADPVGYRHRPVATFRKPAQQRDAQPSLNVMKARSRRGKAKGKV